MSHDHHNHDHHAMENHEHTPVVSGDSCCPSTDAPASSGQHMMHHMMSVSYVR